MPQASFTTVGIFLLLLSHSASPLADDDVGGGAKLLPADESGFAVVEARGTTTVEKTLTKGEVWSSPTLHPHLELNDVHAVDSTIMATYTIVETTTFVIPTDTPHLQNDYSWVLTASVYTQMAGPQEAIIYKRPILTLDVFRDSNAACFTPGETPSVTRTPDFPEDILPTTVSSRVSGLLQSQLTRWEECRGTSYSHRGTHRQLFGFTRAYANITSFFIRPITPTFSRHKHPRRQ